MKKLMMAAAIVCAAVVAQAATINWSQIESEIYAANGSTIVADAMPIYLVISTLSQTDFVAAYAAANGDMSATIAAIGSHVASGAGESIDGYIDNTYSTFASADVEAYYVVFAKDENGKDMAYLSDIAQADVNPLDPTSSAIEFGLPTNSELAAVNASAYAGGAGWVNVPEPTSGLLMLLGMAGLALRRRRA